MPELPEIEVLRRDLEKEVLGRRIKEAEVRSTRNAMKVIRRHGRRKEFQDMLVGAKVEKIERSTRFLVLELDNGNAFVVHLGQTGRLFKTSASDPIAAHTHIVLSFTIGGQLRIIDPKLTGEAFVIPSEQIDSMSEFSPTALDPLNNQNALTWQHFSSLLEQRGSTMKELLMDEHFIVGLGDIYSDEVLFGAGLRYDRPSDKLSSQDVRRLYRALMEIMQEAVKARGTTQGADGFRDLGGAEGMYQIELKVYERDGEPCRRCRNRIERAEFAGGVTYFCPQCQT
jgi:formamidopyrimidine-DNA glycosylase